MGISAESAKRKAEGGKEFRAGIPGCISWSPCIGHSY